jgi:hypothetical protein
MHNSATAPELHRFSPHEDLQRAVESLLAVTLAIDKVSAQSGQTGSETHGQTTAKFLLNLVHFLDQFAVAAAAESARVTTGRHDGVHGGAKEQADGFIDVLLCCDGREFELGERF